MVRGGGGVNALAGASTTFTKPCSSDRQVWGSSCKEGVKKGQGEQRQGWWGGGGGLNALAGGVHHALQL